VLKTSTKTESGNPSRSKRNSWQQATEYFVFLAFFSPQTNKAKTQWAGKWQNL